MRKIMIITALVLLSSYLVGAQASTTYCNGSDVITQLAPWYCSQANQAIMNYWSGWEPIALAAVFVAFSIAAVIFAISALLKSSKIRNFAIGEFYEATATAIMVVGFLFITAVLVGLVPSLVIGNSSPYVSSLSYINGTITSTQNLITQLFQIGISNSYYASLSLKFCNLTSGNCIDKILGVFTYPITIFFVVPATTLVNLLLDGLVLLYGELYLIIIFMYAAVPVFLIPGIIMRAIFPLRGVGGMMIAIAIGFFIIMPTLFSVAFYFTNVGLQGQLASSTSQLVLYGNGAGAQLNSISQSSPLPLALSSINQSLGAFWMSVLFYPALIWALTYVSIVRISEFIGGSTQMGSRFRIL